MKLTILAATGRTGRHVLGQAIEAGHEVTAVARDPRGLDHDGPMVTVDLNCPDVAALGAAVEGAGAVLSCLGARDRSEAGIAETGTRAIVDAMHAAGTRRLVVISSESMTTTPSPGRPDPPRHDPGEGFLLRHIIGPPARRLLRRVYADLAMMEDVVRGSGLDWTIARPALLIDRPLTGTYRTAEGHKPRGGFRISRPDLAHFMLDAIRRPETVGRALTVTY